MLTRWKPMNNYVGFQNDIDRLFEALRPTAGFASGSAFAPALDLKETKDAYTLEVDLPGFKKDDVKITFEDQVLSVSGERQAETREENEKHHHIERSYGRFERRVRLAAPIDAESVKARFEDGVLSVTLPKSEEARTRTIQIG